jgi:uncharacterized lipoprotein YehR (DUF1307 family)
MKRAMMSVAGMLALALALSLSLTGCGSDSKGRPEVSAPLNNVEDQIQYKEDTKKELKKMTDDRQKQFDEAMGKK